MSFLNADTYAERSQGQNLPAGTGIAPGFHSQALPGLGDQAFELTGIHFAELVVAKGRYRMAFEVDIGLTEALTPELQLGRVVVARV